jgi:hypothetical protein
MDDIDIVADIVFSQPLCSADEVADKILQTARDGKMERITGGAMSGLMTHVGYLSPGIKRIIRPVKVVDQGNMLVLHYVLEKGEQIILRDGTRANKKESRIIKKG